MIAAILMSAVLSGTPAVEAPAPVTTTFSDADRKKALALLEQLHTEMNGAQPTKTPDGKTAPPEKTMADVADKVLDMSAKYITQIASMVEQVAPKVWRVMIIQQYAKAAGQVMNPLLTMLVMIVYSVVFRKMWKLPDGEKNDKFFDYEIPLTQRGARGLVTFLFPLVVGTISALVFVNHLSDAAMYIINPDYYALKDLLRLVFNPGSM